MGSIYGVTQIVEVVGQQLEACQEDDAKVAKCPFCQQEFGSWTFRRHHCRICGRVVCADPQTGCSGEVGLNVANPTFPTSEKPGANSISIDIRMCRDCKSTIFAKRDFVDSIIYKPPDQRAYETLRQFERGIKQLLPSFQRALLPERDPMGNTHVIVAAHRSFGVYNYMHVPCMRIL